MIAKLFDNELFEELFLTSQMFSNLDINIFCNKLYLFLFYYAEIIEMLHNSLRRDQTLTEIMLLIFKNLFRKSRRE